jgi:hypothetical protein
MCDHRNAKDVCVSCGRRYCDHCGSISHRECFDCLNDFDYENYGKSRAPFKDAAAVCVRR